MTTQVTDYIDVSKKINQLNGVFPEGISILPPGFEGLKKLEGHRSNSEASTVKTLMRNHDIPYGDIYTEGQKPKYIQNNALEWVAPTLFISSFFLTQNPSLVAIALSVIANYATDFFKGTVGDKKVKLDIVVETQKGKTFKKISFEGDPEGLKSLEGVIKELRDEK